MGDNVTVARLPPIERKVSSPTGPSHRQQPVQTSSPIKNDSVGRIDTWPAHASERGLLGPQMYVNDHKRFVVIDKRDGSHSVTKPKFLQHIEDFMKKELECLGVTEDAHDTELNPLRLQVYRQVFGYLIDDFKTYKPLLSAIRNEYEIMIASQQEQINRLLPLQQMLVAVAEQCDQKVLAIHEQEKKEMAQLRTENRELLKDIEEMRAEQMSLDQQVWRLKEELSNEHLRYREESDARKLLVVNINELHYQQEMAATRRNAEAFEGDKEDPVILRIALKKAREDEASATRRLNEMIANYGDVIPRRDYEQLQTHYQNLEGKLEILAKDYKSLNAEHDTLLEVHRQVLQQRDDYFIEAETLHRSATPRPNWLRCADYFAGGEKHWRQATEGKTSEEIVDILLNELDGTSDAAQPSGTTSFFEGLGIDESVPKYLRTEGKVRSRKLLKRDCLLYVHEIWHQKRSLEDAQRANGKRAKLSDFLHDYLNKTFHFEGLALEWGYSLRHYLEKYSNTDDQIRLFWNVLSDMGDEELYHDFLLLASRLMMCLSAADTVKTGFLSKEDFRAALTGFSAFRVKTLEAISSLIHAAGFEENELVAYPNLFKEDIAGQTGTFLAELHKQTEEERLNFVQEIIANLDSQRFVSIEEFRTAVLSTDPYLDNDALTHCLQWVFADVMKPTQLRLRLDLETLTRRLEMCSVYRVGPKL